jgi:hypothetical protein
MVLPIGSISETIFASDSQVEVAYSSYDALLLDTFYPESNIINDSGQILFSQPLSAGLFLDNTGNTPKLISQILHGEFGQNNFEAKIFAIDNAMGIIDHDLTKTTLFPNPASDTFRIQSSDRRITSLEIIDVYGKIVDQVNEAEIVSYVNYKLSTGIYVIRLTDSQQDQSTHKMIISRK